MSMRSIVAGIGLPGSLEEPEYIQNNYKSPVQPQIRELPVILGEPGLCRTVMIIV
ncbi:hypothetical protein [Paenibacillus sp. MMS20-IR301]|uniref:hypothetical protein n=1 Tax=Paenibacillus sp. MMS20-IR301 TaxID=2895946 RepID=UPI0028EF0EF4|nr:hypothetical protein [Paenibacillus sp. MMS20-IR301]WNS41325.1 hypothetical protein LOS79_20070 [Paenibacillus sp. MMS20-IR301]